MQDYTFQTEKQPPGVTTATEQNRIWPIRAAKTGTGATITPGITSETPVLCPWDINSRLSECYKYEKFSTGVPSISIMFRTPPELEPVKLLRNKQIVGFGDIPFTLKVFRGVTYGSGGTPQGTHCNDENHPDPDCGALFKSVDGLAGKVTLNATFTGGAQITDLAIIDGPLTAYIVEEKFPFYFKKNTLYAIEIKRIGAVNGNMGISFWFAQVPAGK